MFQRILVGLDGSPLGRQAFQTALEFARLYSADLIALSVPITFGTAMVALPSMYGNEFYHAYAMRLEVERSPSSASRTLR
jgi:nucleotide-binding universal stress UspA family protein